MKNKVFNFRAVPVLLLAAVAGILISVPVSLTVSGILCAVVLAVAAVAFALSFRHKNFNKHFKRLVVFCAIILAFAASGLITNVQNESRAGFAGNVTVTGTVAIETPHTTDGEVDFYTSTQKHFYIKNAVTEGGRKLDGKIYVYADGYVDGLAVGDRVTVTGVLSANDFDPFDSRSVSKYKKRQYYELSTEDGYLKSVEKGESSFIDKIKIKTRANLHRFSDAATADFMYAMMYGDSVYMEYDVRSSFSVIGVAHIFSVSGLHVGIIAGAVMLLVKKLLRRKQSAAFIITEAVLIFYCVVCGFTPSVVRATVMFSVYMVSKLLGRKNDGISTVSLAALLILFAKPAYLFDMSFLMSFLAVVGIIFFSPKMSKAMQRKRVPRPIAEALSVSISANIGLLPVMLHYFGSVSLLFLPANLIIVPFMSLFFPLLWLGVLLTFLHPFFGGLITASGWVFWLIREFSAVLASVPFFKIAYDMPWELIVVYVIFITLISRYSLIKNKFKSLVALVMAAAITVNVIVTADNTVIKENTVYVATDEYLDSNTSYVFVRSRELGNVLIINGEANTYFLRRIANRLSEYYVGIDTVVKYRMSDSDSRAVASVCGTLGITKAVTKTGNNSLAMYAEGIEQHAYLSSKSVSVDLLLSGHIMLIVDGTRILIFDYAMGGEVTEADKAYYHLIIKREAQDDFTFLPSGGKLKGMKTPKVQIA